VKGLWRHPDFLKLWAGQSVSLFGTQVSLLAIPLAAVLTLKASPFQMGLLTAAGSAPALIFGLLAGVWVDRLRRRLILIVADAGRCVLLALIPLAYALGFLRIELLFVLAFLVGILSIFFDVAYQSYLPSLVERKYLVEGNSKLELSDSAATIAGPGLAGALVQLFSAPVAILADALSFLVSALSLAWIRKVEEPLAVEAQQKRIGREILEGLRFVSGDSRLRALACSYGMLAFFNSVLEAVGILYLTRQIGISPALLGVIFAIASVGFVAGALLAARLTRWLGVGLTLLLAPVVLGASDLLIPLVGLVPFLAFPLVGIAQFVFGLARPVWRINQISLRQSITPENLLGRMNASISFIVYGLPTLGALLGGVLGQRVGLQATLVIAAVGEILACLWIFFSPVRQLKEQGAA
jgi:MFS family permease